MRATATAAPARHRFTVDEFYRMVDAGIFMEDDPVELIEGEIIEMSPEGSPHAACITDQAEILQERLRGRAIIRVQHPIHLGDNSEPEPDIAVVRLRDDRYRSGHPRPEDVLLAIEVAHSTLAFDRETKIPNYGRNGIPESRLWDLLGRCVHVFRDPGPDGYATVATYRGSDVLSPLAFPEVEVRVDQVF